VLSAAERNALRLEHAKFLIENLRRLAAESIAARGARQAADAGSAGAEAALRGQAVQVSKLSREQVDDDGPNPLGQHRATREEVVTGVSVGCGREDELDERAPPRGHRRRLIEDIQPRQGELRPGEPHLGSLELDGLSEPGFHSHRDRDGGATGARGVVAAEQREERMERMEDGGG